MSSPYFALVRFEDGNTPYAVKCEDIKSFDPVHSKDYDGKKLYDVLWQTGTESLDGYFKATITCMAGEYCTVCI
jgi:ketosteroid isomerase-like protein